MAHEMVDACHVKSEILVHLDGLAAAVRLRPLHRNEVDSLEACDTRHLTRDIEQPAAAALVLGVALHVLRAPHPHDRLVVDSQVLWRIEVVLDPELRHLSLILDGVASDRVVVRPHHRPFDVAAVFRLVERLDPVIEVL